MYNVHTYAKNNSTWYRTSEEVNQLHIKHYNRNVGLPNRVYEKNGKYIGTTNYWNKIEFELSLNFIESVKRHLTEMIEKDWIKFIYWADLNHGHIFVSKKIFKTVYGKALNDAIVNKKRDKYYYEAWSKDKNLGILYHAAEHFKRCEKNEKYLWTRNIVGWFDNRKPIELIKYGKDEKEFSGKACPAGTRQITHLSISAWKYGEFVIYPDGKELRFDMSFGVEDVYDGFGKGLYRSAPDYN